MRLRIDINKTWLYVFIIVSITDFYIVLLGSSIKILYLFSVPVLAFALVNVRKKGDLLFELFLLGWYLSFFLAMPHLISFHDWLRILIGQCVLFLIYRAMCVIKDIWYYERLFLFMLVLVATIGILQVALYFLVGSTWGVSHYNEFIGIPRPSSLTIEPDWYGLLCMVSSLWFLTNIVSRKYIYTRRKDGICLMLSMCGMFLSMARAAWVGFFFGCLYQIMSNIPRKSKHRMVKVAIMASIVLALFMLMLLFYSEELFEKVLNRILINKTISTDGGSWLSRQYAIEIMWSYFLLHPLTGNGAGGMGAITSNRELLQDMGYMYYVNQGRGTTNIILGNLFDVGIVGTLFLTAAFIRIFVMMNARYKKTNDHSFIIYASIILAMLVDFQFNNGLRQVYVWIILGFTMNRLTRSNAIIKRGKSTSQYA